jgi:hypothetical protein
MWVKRNWCLPTKVLQEAYLSSCWIWSVHERNNQPDGKIWKYLDIKANLYRFNLLHAAAELKLTLHQWKVSLHNQMKYLD